MYTHIYIYIYIDKYLGIYGGEDCHIYIYIYREREREISTLVCLSDARFDSSRLTRCRLLGLREHLLDDRLANASHIPFYLSFELGSLGVRIETCSRVVQRDLGPCSSAVLGVPRGAFKRANASTRNNLSRSRSNSR